MATRARRQWKPDKHGYYTRQIGWKLSKAGIRQQHKFILGTDLEVARSVVKGAAEFILARNGSETPTHYAERLPALQ